jgi:hypothetical protein
MTTPIENLRTIGGVADQLADIAFLLDAAALAATGAEYAGNSDRDAIVALIRVIERELKLAQDACV